jgi:hypothetical protein
MVAYSFRPRFAEPIANRTKTQTIRNDRARHARPGERLQLYTGMRTRHCRLITDKVLCSTVEPIRLSFHREHGPLIFTRGGANMSGEEMEAFAIEDGFSGKHSRGGLAIFDMSDFWFEQHAKLTVNTIEFSGVLIRWFWEDGR